MPNREMRQAQVITTFGPGSIVDYGGESFMISIADDWKYPGGDAIDNHKIKDERRLLKRLGCNELRTPPLSDGQLGSVTAIRFPEWLYCKKCGKFQPYAEWKSDWIQIIDAAPRNQTVFGNRSLYDYLRHKRFETPECAHCYRKLRNEKGYKWERTPKFRLIPTRFVVACRKGHISDFPWVAWCHNGKDNVCSHPSLKYSAGGGSGGLESIRVTCQCGLSNSLRGAFHAKALDNIGEVCSGLSPWISWESSGCGEPLRTLQRGGSNLYYPAHYSSITIPPESTEKQQQLRRLPEFKSIQKRFDNRMVAADDFDEQGAGEALPDREAIFDEIIKKYEGDIEEIAVFLDTTVDNTKSVIRAILLGEETVSYAIDDELHYRLDEYRYLTKDCGENSPDCLLYVKTAESVDPHFSLINQVFRLREVSALTEFTRIVPRGQDYEHGRDNRLEPEPAPVVRKSCRWFPAVKGFGEGVFIKFDPEKLGGWDLKDRYTLIHTFSHLVMRRLSFDAGYSLASLKERIYCPRETCGDEIASMCGVLIYTVSTDPAGTLGGLVRLGVEDRIMTIIKAAVRDAQFCSSDPLCWETTTGNDNTAACFACTFLPETSCENRNTQLNRKLLVDPENGYFKGWI